MLIFAVERNRFDWMNIARFTAGRDEFFPISQAQMKWQKVIIHKIGY